MRALVSTAPGDWRSLVMMELPALRCGPDEVRIRVAAVSINYPDALMIEDRYQFRPVRPFAPGCEVSGILLEVGTNVRRLKPGMRVIALSGYGGMAEEILVAGDKVCEIPDEMPFDVAASLILSYGTSWHALADRGQLGAGQSLLVLGAAGGVGTAAIELGKALGAYVVAGVSSESKADVARQMGANEVFVYPQAPFDEETKRSLTSRLKNLAGPGGFDVIFDPIGGDYVQPSLRSIGWQGRYLVIGFTVGIADLPMNLVLLKGCQIVGVFWGAFIDRTPGELARETSALIELWRAGKIAPLISSHYSFEDGGVAISELAERRATGKVVVWVNPEL